MGQAVPRRWPVTLAALVNKIMTGANAKSAQRVSPLRACHACPLIKSDRNLVRIADTRIGYTDR